jgi:hypothetical protein
MSWIDQIENRAFSITTGDGRVYTPLLRVSETNKEFNTSVFDFINKEGSLIDRKKVKARKFPLTFYFQGADNIKMADEFDHSANDPRAWNVVHPFYGSIVGQPLSLSRNDSSFNVTEINVDFWETITDVLPKQGVSIPDIISAKQIDFKVIAPVDYANKVDLKPADVTRVKTISEQLTGTISSALDAASYNDFQQLKNEMATKVDNLITSPVAAIQSIMDVIEMPGKLNTSTLLRIELAQAVYANVKAILAKFNSNNKAYFEVNGGAAIISMANIVIRPDIGDFVTRSELQLIADSLINLYTDYRTTVDNSYVKDVDVTNRFSASAQIQNLVRDTVVSTVNGLIGQALNAKQERVVLLEKDSNLILLTHKYMGLDTSDENLTRFRKINNIKNKKLFSIKKGTPIRYYV